MSKEYFLGIDVSKGYSDFILLNDRSEVVEDFFQLDDTVEGHHRLEALLKRYYEAEPDLRIYCGLESTGGYEDNWYNFLMTLVNYLDLKLVRINPVKIKGISKASLNRTITDETSALNIAHYVIGYKGKIDFNKECANNSSFQDSRSIYVHLTMLTKQETQFLNQLQILTYKSTPELLTFCSRGFPMWLLRLIAKYPTAREIRKAGIEKLTTINGVSITRAKNVIELVAKNENHFSSEIAFVIKHTVSEILEKKAKILEIESYLSKKYANHPTIKLLTSIKGVGLSSAITILFEIEDINRFATVKNLVAYFGINPEFRQSGDGTYGNHMSKKGRKSLRSVLYMCGFAASNWDPMMKELYKSYRAKGKKHDFAIGVLMHKLLRIIYGVLKSGKPYDISIDKANKERSFDKQKSIEDCKKQQIINNREKKRRYLRAENPLTAPISGRKAREIRKLATSLNTESAMVQDHHQPVQK